MLDLPDNKDKKASSKKSPAKVQSKDRDMGAALRSAYQKTIEEQVPDEMLDLLNKLA
ncbi:NepR family anti-sigma factor [Sphingomonas sp. NIC1]|uniref:NepR family anti-sigma factor n=1 Tax=Sphingomonas sp. NIC1 TaxID=1961362 RepID=UPI000AFCD7E6|nr:NepR family anti-sigma factor [Sphingomonas sp. NIC1]